jgi:hypothetical protein
MTAQCKHTCRDKCRALEYAQLLELKVIREFTAYRDECDYPDVKTMLAELIAGHERSLALLCEKRDQLSATFDVLHLIQESFEEHRHPDETHDARIR